MAGVPEVKEYLFKILVVGENGVGKTSIIKRYVHQLFSETYRVTIGVDFSLKVVKWDSTTLIRLQLWDIAGQERFGNMTSLYFRKAVGAFVVFDLSRDCTLEAVTRWKEDVDSKAKLPDGGPIPTVLLANKCDQTSQYTDSFLDSFCQDAGFLGWFRTSAKENINVEEAVRFLVKSILKNACGEPLEWLSDSVNLDQVPVKAENRVKCC